MKKVKQKKIGTLTFHIAHNFGAMLQAYALQRAICRLGGDCEVIDYRFPYIDQWSGIRTLRDLWQESGWLIGSLRFLNRCRKGYYRRCTPMQKKFDAFMRSMKLSRVTYFCKEQLFSAPYDYVVTGSDQIWNPALTDGLAEEYFGQCFDLNRTQLVAYAASNGKDHLPEEFSSQMSEWLRGYRALGIREKTLADNLRDYHGLSTCAAPDPVFLLSQSEWAHLSQRSSLRIDKPYLLLYAFQVDGTIYDIARRIAAERQLKLVSIQYKYNPELSDMLQFTDCGPLDFLALLRNADFVCTSSFHGNAFAIIFEKQFFCVGHPLYSQRNRDMLTMLGLSHRFVAGVSEIATVNDIDYSDCRACLQKHVAHAEQFLMKNLELC